MARQRLPSRLHLVSVRVVQTAGEGEYSDGGGLLLRIQGDSPTWVLRYGSPNVKRREMGLGSANLGNAQTAGKSLTDARALANDARQTVVESNRPDRRSRPAQVRAEGVGAHPQVT